MIANTDDTTTPVAHACKTRPRSSTGKTGAVAQTREPTTNRPRPPRMRRREGNLPTEKATENGDLLYVWGQRRSCVVR